jgi:hypothetical protein
MLKAVRPNAKAMYQIVPGHVVTEIDGRFYDITGEVQPTPCQIELDSEPRIMEAAKFWSFDRGLV